MILILLLMLSYIIIVCLWVLAFIASLTGFSLDEEYCVALAPLAIAGIAAGAGSALGGLFNAMSTSSSNSANASMNQETRDWQSKENEVARQWSEQMWEKNNQYNTPSAQAARLREAGFNPYLLGSSEIGNGQSTLPTANTNAASPSMIPNRPVDFSPMISGITSAASSAIQGTAVNSQVANQTADTQRQILENARELQKMYPNQPWIAQKYVSQHLQSLEGLSLDSNLYSKQAVAEVKKQEAEASLAETNASLEKKYGDKKYQNILALQEQEFNKMAAEIRKMASDASLNPYKIKELISQYWKNCAESGMLQKLGNKYAADTQTINALRNGLVQRCNIEAASLDLQYQTQSVLFDADEGVRGYLTSKDAKMNRAKSAKLQNNRFVNAVGTASGIARNWLPSFVVPITGNGRSISSGFENNSVFESGWYE